MPQASQDIVYRKAASIILSNGDLAKVGQHILWQDGQEELHPACLEEILAAETASGYPRMAHHLLVRKLKIGPVALPYQMPRLISSGEYLIISPQVR